MSQLISYPSICISAIGHVTELLGICEFLPSIVMKKKKKHRRRNYSDLFIQVKHIFIRKLRLVFFVCFYEIEIIANEI